MSADTSPSFAAAFRANVVNFMNFAGHIDVEMLGRAEWASVTFVGARHRLRLVFDGAGAPGAAADFLAALPEIELTIPGQIVADLALVAEERGDRGDHAMLELEALTIADC